MRLIECETLELREFFGSAIPEYAILSHTWEDEEVSFVEFTSNHAAAQEKGGFHKINFLCTQALKDGYVWAWIDTCCIDKSSSAELSEAINSMFHWYENSGVCYVCFSDVRKEYFGEQFPKSRWWRRGWTLQELVAPQNVEFYDAEWLLLGSKAKLTDLISDFTKIDKRALRRSRGPLGTLEPNLGVFCVAKRMSWASNRETTRLEDTAYCLLGIFDVNMPLLYGEGDKAFFRLQEEIMRSHNDQSILAWGLDMQAPSPEGMPPGSDFTKWGDFSSSRLLAISPKAFEGCHSLGYGLRTSSPLTTTNIGLQLEMTLMPIHTRTGYWAPFSPPMTEKWIAVLDCSTENDTELLGILLATGDSGNDPSQSQMERVPLQPKSSKYTLLVGPRALTDARRIKITILRNESSSVRNIFLKTTQVAVNMDKVLLDLGYTFQTVGQKNPFEESTPSAGDSSSVWDPKTRIWTVHNSLDIHHDGGVQFLLHSHKVKDPPPDFCLYVYSMLGSDGPIGKVFWFLGSSYDATQAYGFSASMETPSRPNARVLVGSEGQKYVVDVKIKQRTVCHWQIYEINIGARSEAQWLKEVLIPIKS